MEFDIEAWTPKTRLGKMVKSGDISSIDEILSNNYKIQEPEIVDALLPELDMELVLIGQAKGKFGGGSRRPFKHTQKKVREGARLKFSYVAVVGNKDGYVGVGRGSSRATLPARQRAINNAKMNLIKIPRGCGSWQCKCGEPHSIPTKVEGKCGSVRVMLYPAPKGIKLALNEESRKILTFGGVNDVWSQTKGQTRSRINLAFATFEALKKLHDFTYSTEFTRTAGIKI